MKIRTNALSLAAAGAATLAALALSGGAQAQCYPGYWGYCSPYYGYGYSAEWSLRHQNAAGPGYISPMGSFTMNPGPAYAGSNHG